MSDEPQERGWTFFSNHAHVLFCLAQGQDARLRDVASRVGITERAVQRIVADLEREGYVSIARVGRRNRYTIHQELPLRHPVERGVKVSALLQMVEVAPEGGG